MTYPLAASATVFAVALLCAGQTSSITATLSGQIVAEGFLEWRLSVRTARLPLSDMILTDSRTALLATSLNAID